MKVMAFSAWWNNNIPISYLRWQGTPRRIQGARKLNMKSFFPTRNLTTISLCLVSSYFLIVFLIFPSCFLMDTFHEAMFQSEFCSPTNRSKTPGQPNCGVPNGCADWRSELGQLAIDMLRISMCHLKVGECSNTFH